MFKNLLNRQLPKPDVFSLLFFVSLFSVGLFHDYISCIASVVLSVALIIYAIRNKKLVIYINLITISAFVAVLFYGLSCFWAVDSGMAFIGFLKNFPILLFLLCFMQNKQSKDTMFAWLPYVMTVMTVLSALFAQIPFTSSFFTVASRLSGFFQYPNTFAIILLVTSLVLISKEKLDIVDWLMLAVFMFGIMYSGSRTVFVLTIVSIPLCMLFTKKKAARLALLGVTGLFAVIVVVALIFSFDRFLSISLNSSALLGRLLYWQDALKLIIKHPFGMGYMGYYYVQQTIQTGLYSVMYTHNELLQFMVDIGWVPAILIFASVIRPVFSKKCNPYMRLALVMFILHSLFDFDLQFVALLVLMLLFTDFTEGKKYTLRGATLPVVVLSSLSVVFCYFSVVLTLFACSKTEAVNKLYPWHTQNQIARLSLTTKTDELDVIADKIIKQNDYVSVAYSAKARYAFSKGDITSLIKHKNKAIELAPFQYQEYEEYCYMLMHSISLYENAKDENSVEFCKNELLRTNDKLHSLRKKLSKLGSKIIDIPNTKLPDDINNYISEIEKSR